MICTCSYVVALSIPIIIIIVIVFVRMLNVIGPKSMGECLLMMTMIMVLFVCVIISLGQILIVVYGTVWVRFVFVNNNNEKVNRS